MKINHPKVVEVSIAFARPEYVSRSNSANACCKSSYNARTKIKDERSNVVYNFSTRLDNVHHEILLPEHADIKFKNPSILANEVERTEKKTNSQLYVEWLLALPKEENVPLQLKLEMVYEFINRKGWIKEGLGVQIDIHKPHDGEENWHAHLLVTTRRFTPDGKELGEKARDLQPEIRYGKVQKTVEIDNNIFWRDVQNDLFKKYGMKNRVDFNSTMPQEHIGPVRMRKFLNAAVERNEMRAIAHLDNMKSGDNVLDRITRLQSVFSKYDIEKAVKDIPDLAVRKRLIAEALASKRLVPLYISADNATINEKVDKTPYYTTKIVRLEEERIIRIAAKIKERNNHSRTPSTALAIKDYVKEGKVSQAQKVVLEEILLRDGGIRILRGRAGTGKSHVLGVANQILEAQGKRVVGLAPTSKASTELKNKGFKETFTVKGFLFAIYNGRVQLSRNSTIIVDEAGMIANSDLLELVKAVNILKCNLILAGDERQLTSVERGGLFEIIAERFGSCELAEIRRQSQNWSREMASCFAHGDIARGIDILQANGGIYASAHLASSVEGLIGKWKQSKFPIDKRLIITVKNTDVDALNSGIRRILKENGLLKGAAFTIERMEKNHGTDQSDKNDKDFISVTREFMAGDRIMFAATNKELGIQNGELGTLLKVSKDQFIVRIDGDKEIAFNPVEIEGLKHGYAVTTYKSQGSSIEVVYVLHSGAGNSRNTYVNLTRHINEVSLFYSMDITRNISHLKLQLARIDEKSSSLKFITNDDIARHLELMNQTAMQKVGNWFKAKATAIGDKLHSNPDYYKFESPLISKAKVEEVLAQTYERIEQHREIVMASEALAERSHPEQHVKNEELFALDKESGSPRSLPGAALLHDSQSVSHDSPEVIPNTHTGHPELDWQEPPFGSAGHPELDSGSQDFMRSRRPASGMTYRGLRDSTSVSHATSPTVAHDNVSEVEKELIARSALNPANIVKAEVAAQTHAQAQQIAVSSGGSRTRIRNTQTAKQRFYEKVDKPLQKKVRDYKAELENLKHELKFKAERIALNLLDDQNKRLSNKNIYRYGERGSFAVSVGGNKAGTWYDFEAGIGGDMISLVQRETKKDFKESVEWLKDFVGISRQSTLKLVHDNEARDKYVNQITDDIKTKAKQAREEKKIHKLYEKSKEITTKNIASRYLRQERNVKCTTEEDIRTTGIWDKAKARHYPAIVAFARDNAGKITGGQTILLDPETAKKADVNIVKKSFGKIGGSFVEVRKPLENQNKITFIAEGLETALSIKEAGVTGLILCSLGVGNIKTYKPEAGEKIMICADNDGAGSKTAEIVENARNVFENQGAVVHIIAPQEKGDFNDVLKMEGVLGVKNYLEPGIEKLVNDNGFSRSTEKLAAITAELHRGKPELKEEIAKFEEGTRLVAKFAPNSSYKVVKAYSENGFESASMVASKQVSRSISQSIEKSLEDFDKLGDKAELKDFKGNKYTDKIDYLAGLATDKEIMSCLGLSHWSGEIHKAVSMKKIIAEDRRKEFELTIRLNQEKLNDMVKLDPKFDLEKFKDELKELPDKTREEKIKMLWLGSFKDHIASKLDHFDKLKQEAKTIELHLEALKEQKEFSSKVREPYQNLISQARITFKDTRIDHLMFIERKQPDFINILARDLKHGVDIGLWLESEALARLKSTKHLGFLTDDVTRDCRKHYVAIIEKDLERIDSGRIVEKDQQRFETHKAYLEHNINNQTLQPYLKNTIVTQKLTAIYKQEELQKQQAFKPQKTKAIEKDHGMGGFGL